MQLIDRIGIDIGIKQSVEDGLRWAATHGLHYVDFRLDTGPEAFDAFTAERCAALRTRQDPQFHGHYMCAFGSLEVMLTGRAYLAQEAAAALG